MVVAPKVVAGVRKSLAGLPDRPRIAGELVWLGDGSRRFVEVRDGCLAVFGASQRRGRPEVRVPLRALNLRPGPRPLAIALSRPGAPPLAALQASSQEEYEQWVKAVAVELLRQTPLEAVRTLDILGITATLRGPDEVGALLRRCQRPDGAASVRDKRRLFEALGRRLARSSDALNAPQAAGPRRARSLHDLSRCTQGVAVREMCRLFEQRGAASEAAATPVPQWPPNAFLAHRRGQRAQQRLDQLRHMAAAAEDTMWRLQGKMAALDHARRYDGATYSQMEAKLQKEEEQLSLIHQEASNVLKVIELEAHKFETALVQCADQDQSD